MDTAHSVMAPTGLVEAFDMVHSKRRNIGVLDMFSDVVVSVESACIV